MNDVVCGIISPSLVCALFRITRKARSRTGLVLLEDFMACKGQGSIHLVRVVTIFIKVDFEFEVLSDAAFSQNDKDVRDALCNEWFLKRIYLTKSNTCK